MSRIGNQPIEIPNNVQVEKKDGRIYVKGPKGQLDFTLPEGIEVEITEGVIKVKRVSDKQTHKMLHGTVRSIINNMIIGVSQGFVKELEIHGVGYKVELAGNKLALYLGYNHPIYVDIPSDVTVEVPSNTEIRISGIDKQRVGQFAAFIRDHKKPDVYKGKGIRYKGEVIRKKEVKTSV